MYARYQSMMIDIRILLQHVYAQRTYFFKWNEQCYNSYVFYNRFVSSKAALRQTAREFFLFPRSSSNK